MNENKIIKQIAYIILHDRAYNQRLSIRRIQHARQAIIRLVFYRNT